ncbi:hypothetical protein MYAM1_001506 [Malassezia yamatoensis]|uniref:Triacylglycerol lipase n=1 Tax=Malassezia yamatoensis TaxID=253288 RepID=A0AAJ6CGG7_9BASI|nr:hypothetical protein MYAM1_001506 [Malassezia yamatoensis]
MVKLVDLVLLCSLLLAVAVSGAPAVDTQGQDLHRRQYSYDDQESIADQSSDDPVGATKKVLKMPNLGDTDSGTFHKKKYGALVSSEYGDDSQVPWFDNGDFPFIQTVDDTAEDGWSFVPGEFHGFEMKYDLDISSDSTKITQPYYSMTGMNDSQVKRVLISLPGLQRDSWKYANLFYNALRYVQAKNKFGVEEGDVLIVAPVVLNLDDQAAGGTNGDDSDWAVYRKSNWEFGGSTHSPKADHSVSFYTALDKLIEKYLDKDQYPNVEKIVLAGHSLGGQAVQRYALLKHEKSYDDQIMYWVGNPGAYTWLTSDRPTDADCGDSVNEFPYGLGSSSTFPKYVQKMFDDGQNAGDLVNRFRSRKVRYAFGLLDNGAGDTHCEAYTQGANHLQRGANFVKNLDDNGGFPDSHSVSYVAGLSHQDYPMIAAEPSLQYLFSES